MVSLNNGKSGDKAKYFICNFEGCFKEFSKNRSFQNHLKLHTGERPFVCDVSDCFKTYTNSSHLRRHKATKHGGEIKKIMCTVEGCERELVNKTSLKKHIFRWHNSNRIYPFMCNECHQGFYRKQQLQEHSYLHTGKLPFSCDQCQAKFMTAKARNKHKRVHKIHICNCGDRFNKWTAFLAHGKECKLKRLKCNVCNKTFSRMHNLKMHSNTHVGKDERSIYMCPYDECQRYYFYKTNLTVHINNVHMKIQKQKIPCSVEGCNKLLVKMQNYKAHLKTHEESHKPKLARKIRKDKGKLKKKAIDELCGFVCLDKSKCQENIFSNNESINSYTKIDQFEHIQENNKVSLVCK